MTIKKRCIATGILASVAILVIAFTVIPQKKQKAFDEHLRDVAGLPESDDADGDNGGDNINPSPVNFKELWKVNKDIVAWIEIPDTDISCPVLQSDKEHDDFYLNHDIYKTKNSHGAIYMQNINHKDFRDFDTILYGHNMRDGSMFKQLQSYWDMGFFNTHRNINIYTPDKTYHYNVYAVYPGDDNLITDVFNNFKTKQDKQDYLDAIRFSSGNRDETMDPDRTDKLLTLLTCMNDGSRRLLLQAVLVESE